MLNLVLAALFLLVSHFGLPSDALKPRLSQRFGERFYRGLFVLVAFAAFAWLIVAYAHAPYLPLWPPAAWQAILVLLVMPLALLLLVGGVSTPNPSAIGQDQALDRPEPAAGVLRITRHPVQWSFASWALAHLLANGDLASLLLFGTIALLALVGTRVIDARHGAAGGARWQRFAAATSNLPFAAILAGRQQLRPAEIGLQRFAAALGLYVLLLILHPWLFGVAPLAML